MDVRKILEKIAKKRKKKGYSYENMAEDLALTPSGYRKIETGETKLTVERLFRISAILETPINEFLEMDKNAFVQNNYSNESVFQQKIENFYQENKEITDQLIKAKDQLIEQLQKEIQTLKTR